MIARDAWRIERFIGRSPVGEKRHDDMLTAYHDAYTDAPATPTTAERDAVSLRKAPFSAMSLPT